MAATDEKKITFRFVREDDYRVLPVNGVWGGVTPRGDIRVEIFHEYEALPGTVTHVLSPEGQLGEEVGREKPTGLEGKVFDRRVFAGIMLTASQAESIGQWLQAKAADARKREATTASEGDNDIHTN